MFRAGWSSSGPSTNLFPRQGQRPPPRHLLQKSRSLKIGRKKTLHRGLRGYGGHREEEFRRTFKAASRFPATPGWTPVKNPAGLHAIFSPLEKALRLQSHELRRASPFPNPPGNLLHRRRLQVPIEVFPKPAATALDVAFSAAYRRCKRVRKTAASDGTRATAASRDRGLRW